MGRVGAACDHARLLLRREPWWAEWWAGIATLAWALWSWLSPIGLDDKPAWAVLVALMNEGWWQATGATLGAVKLIILLLDHRTARRLSCFFGLWWWSLLTLAVLSVDTSAPSAALYAVFGAINLYSLARLGPEPG